MGRKKLPIERIIGKRARKITFRKRSQGLLKMAKELATLCDVEVAVIVRSEPNALQFYPDNDAEMRKVISRFLHDRPDMHAQTQGITGSEINQQQQDRNMNPIIQELNEVANMREKCEIFTVELKNREKTFLKQLKGVAQRDTGVQIGGDNIEIQCHNKEGASNALDSNETEPMPPINPDEAQARDSLVLSSQGKRDIQSKTPHVHVSGEPTMVAPQALAAHGDNRREAEDRASQEAVDRQMSVLTVPQALAARDDGRIDAEKRAARRKRR